MLAHINQALGGDFNLRSFEHSVRWNGAERRIEMHLRSKEDQTVKLSRANFSCRLSCGETIWTERSHKYNCAEVVSMGERAGYRCDAQWVDAEWPFAQSLFIAT